ncbi:substance-K receptor, partial [Asbolus verrucosus]
IDISNTSFINDIWIIKPTSQIIIESAIYLPILNKYEKVVLRKLDHHRQVNYKKKAVRMMLAIILTFLICRIPFTALIFYRVQSLDIKTLSQSTHVQNSAGGIFHHVWFASKFFIFVNSALNPLIYCTTNERFQRGFRATKMAKWLFPPEKHKPVVTVPKQTQKLLDTPSLFKKSIFFIFKKKQKFSSNPTNDTSVTSGGKNDHQHIIR